MNEVPPVEAEIDVIWITNLRPGAPYLARRVSILSRQMWETTNARFEECFTLRFWSHFERFGFPPNGTRGAQS